MPWHSRRKSRPPRGPCRCAECRRRWSRRRLETTTVEVVDLELGGIDGFETADVDRGLHAFISGAVAEWRAAADRTEMMLDLPALERVRGEVLLRRAEPQLVPRPKPEQIAAPAAD